jgi:hypothetical protein
MAALVLAAAGLYLALRWGMSGFDPVPQADFRRLDVDLAVEDIELRQGRDGRMLWRVRAPVGRYNQETGLVAVDSPRIEYFLEDSTPMITARRGEVAQEQGLASLRDDVLVVWDNATICARALDFNADDDFLVLTGEVRMHKDFLHLMASRIEVFLDRNEIVAPDGVRVDLDFAR